MANKIGNGIAKILGIDLHYRNETGSDTYVEEEPTAAEWIREVIPSGREFSEYCYSLFPFTHWIGRYNVQWLMGDLVAGKYFYSWLKGSI